MILKTPPRKPNVQHEFNGNRSEKNNFQKLNVHQGKFGDHGGAEGNRTPDLLIANEALSHLSYSPTANR